MSSHNFGTTTATSDPAREFLNVFADIEQTLKSRLGLTDYMSPKAMAKRYMEAGGITEDQRTLIIALADLRNAISHASYRDGVAIANPHPETIAEAKQVRDYLRHPPLALDVLQRRHVRTVTLGDSLATALTHVKDDFSQFPVYDNGTYVGLLTTNSIARWLAEQCAVTGAVPQSAQVSHLLEFAEESDRAIHLPADVLVPAVISALCDDDNPLRAVIITNSGHPDEEPVSVAVREDLHLLYGVARS